MTVLSSDFYQFEMDGQVVGRGLCLENALPWPPSKHVAFRGVIWECISYSQLTDEQAMAAKNIARGARFVLHKSELPDDEDFGPTSATKH